MKQRNILIIGGGIGGLTAAIALGKYGHRLTIIEKDPDWSVHGVGINQQSNVVRAMKQLGILDDYLSAGFGFDAVEVFAPDGSKVARIPSPKLVEGYPANVGISRIALHEVLCRRTLETGAEVRPGATVTSLDDDGSQVHAHFSDGRAASYDMVIGADGIYSLTREMIFPDALPVEFTGQGVWRCNFSRLPDLDALRAYNGPIGAGLLPMNESTMYMYATTPEPGNPFYRQEGIGDIMRGKLGPCAPAIRELGETIEDANVAYRPLEIVLHEGAWHKGRVVLLGDAVHATTPHLGQGGGMAIEDGIVLADELAKHDELELAFDAYFKRRFDRCAYIVRASLAICHGQLGKGPQVDHAQATRDMFAVTRQEI